MKNQHIAVRWDTKEIVAQGGFLSVFKHAQTGVIFVTSLESKDFFGAWYREGFWKGVK